MNSRAYGVDPKRIGAVGISAGGHLAAILAVRETRILFKDDLDRFSSKVESAVAINGVYDLSDTTPGLSSPIILQATGNRVELDRPAEERNKVLEEAAPVQFVSKEASPLLLIAGAEDTWVPPGQAKAMAERLSAAGAKTRVVVLENEGHGLFPSMKPMVRKHTFEWLESTLKAR